MYDPNRMIFLGLPIWINRCTTAWIFSGVICQAGSAVVMANCVRCVVKQTFGWQRRQIFPDRYLSGKRPETLQSLPTYGPNIGTTTNIFLCKWPWAEPTITPKALKLSALLD